RHRPDLPGDSVAGGGGREAAARRIPAVLSPAGAPAEAAVLDARGPGVRGVGPVPRGTGADLANAIRQPRGAAGGARLRGGEEGGWGRHGIGVPGGAAGFESGGGLEIDPGWGVGGRGRAGPFSHGG